MIAIKINANNFVHYSVIIFPQTYETNIENFRDTEVATIERYNRTKKKKEKSLITRTITIHVFYVSYRTI